MSEARQDKSVKRDKRTSKVPSEGSHVVKGKDTAGKTKDSLSNVSCIDEHHDENTRLALTLENTYQMGPRKRFPAHAALEILKDVLRSYLQEEKYEVDWSRQMTKTICDPGPREGADDPQVQAGGAGPHRSAGRTEHADQQPLSVGCRLRHLRHLVLQEQLPVRRGLGLRRLLRVTKHLPLLLAWSLVLVCQYTWSGVATLLGQSFSAKTALNHQATIKLVQRLL
ncbi:dynein light chain Tctex-type 5 isoform X1 [Entelurus aequoreus]|uniref:dynein light chain Tctex-type 5 isoform X1 n=1 Tax=Entelurus aequoreus TaxID=161455 RepID=UPI002B1E1137|nr:dynein light chain Tctex-type 5 isoform X1 [Entelurus aequoreus]